MTRRLLLFAIIFAVALPAAAQSRVTLTIGHSAPVTQVRQIDELPVVVSSARDGSVRVWDVRRMALMHAYQLAPLPITHLAAHPDGDQIAIVQSDGLDSHVLTVMEWETGQIVYSVELPARPIYFDYSPQGTYLVYSVPSYRSLYFIDSRTGAERTYLNAGFGIVGFVQISSSEQNVMTYIPNRGRIVYFELLTGAEIRRATTEFDLQQIVALSSRHLVGYRDQTLYVIDNYEGSVEDAIPASGVRDITVTPDGLAVLLETGSRLEMRRYSFNGDELQIQYYRAFGMEQDARLVTTIDRFDTSTPEPVFLVGSDSGVLSLHDIGSGRQTLLAPQPTLEVEHLAWTDGRLHAVSGDRIITLVSDALAVGSPPPTRAGYLRTALRDNLPVTDIVGVDATEDALYLWGRSEDGNGLFRLGPISGRSTLIYEGAERTPLVTAHVSDTSTLLLHRDGALIILDASRLTPTFEYRALGAQDALSTQRFGVVVAKTSSSAFDSSVVRIDPRTQETVAVRTPAFLSTKIIDADDSLYSVGLVESADGSVRTVLIHHAGARLERTEEISSLPRESTDIGAVYHRPTQTVFTTVSSHGVVAYRDGTLEQLPMTAHYPKQLYLANDLLIARNADGSLTFWNARSRVLLFDLYLFEGGEWLAMGRDGGFASSGRDAESNLTFLPSSRTRLERDDFRASFPVELAPGIAD